MVDNIGFPEYLVDNKRLDDEYKDVSIITNKPARTKELLNIGYVIRVLFHLLWFSCLNIDSFINSLFPDAPSSHVL